MIARNTDTLGTLNESIMRNTTYGRMHKALFLNLRFEMIIPGT